MHVYVVCVGMYVCLRIFERVEPLSVSTVNWGNGSQNRVWLVEILKTWSLEADGLHPDPIPYSSVTSDSTYSYYASVFSALNWTAVRSIEIVCKALEIVPGTW